MHKAVWCDEDLQLAEILNQNGREDELNTILGYAMVTIDNRHNTCTRGVIGCIKV